MAQLNTNKVGEVTVFHAKELDLLVQLLKMLKDGPGAHIKTHYYDYTKAVKKEMARIRRIQDLQARVIGFMAMGIGALGVGIANFMSNVFYNKIAYDQYFPSDVGAADA